MIVVNTDAVPGYEIVDIKGMVQGNTVRAKHLGRDIVAGFKNMVGGELKGQGMHHIALGGFGRGVAQHIRVGFDLLNGANGNNSSPFLRFHVICRCLNQQQGGDKIAV